MLGAVAARGLPCLHRSQEAVRELSRETNNAVMAEYLSEFARFWKAVAIAAWWLALALLAIYFCVTIARHILHGPNSTE